MGKDFLNQNEINELIQEAQKGNIEARNKVVENNYRLVTSIAKNFVVNTSMSFEDIYQEGIIGLIKAVDKFDTSKGFKFSTYATWWVKQAIQRNLANNNRSIRLPVHIQEQLSKLRKAHKHLVQELDRDPTIDEIYERINIKMKYYDEIVNHEYFNDLVDVCKTNMSDEITEVEAIIMEDLNFEEDAELICKQIISDIKRNGSVPLYNSVNLKINISKKKIAQLMEYNTSISSLDISANDDVKQSIVSNIPSAETVEDVYNRKMIEEGLPKAIDEVYGNEKKEFRQRIVDKKQVLKEEIFAFNKAKKEAKELTALINSLKADKDNESEVNERENQLTKVNYILESKKVNIRKIEEEISKLTEREKKFIDKAELIKRRYGLCGYKKETLQELGDRFNVSRERIRQIEKQIIGKNTDKSKSIKNPNSKNALLRSKILQYCNLTIEEIE